MQQQKQLQEDEIDLRELFAILKRRQMVIWIGTGLFTLMALFYIINATPIWKAEVTLEIGKKGTNKDGNIAYIESGENVQKRLEVEYVDALKNVKDRNNSIQSISVDKKNPQFITISAVGLSNQLASLEIHKAIDGLIERHSKTIEEIVANKKSQLEGIDRSIFTLQNNSMKNITESIKYISTIQIPTIDKTIKSVSKDLKKSQKQRDEAFENLLSLKNEPSLSALRMGQIQGLESRISSYQIKLINLDREKETITKNTLPAKERALKKLKDIDLVAIRQKRELVVLSMQPHNYHNTAIVGGIITKDYPTKPKKKLILVVAFITGLMFSIFLAFFLEFISSMKRDESNLS